MRKKLWREKAKGKQTHTTSAINATAATVGSRSWDKFLLGARSAASAVAIAKPITETPPHWQAPFKAPTMPPFRPFSTSSITFRLMAAEIRPVSMKFAA